MLLALWHQRYGAQGLFKFGLNEVFKDVYTTAIGPENLQATWAKMAMWAAASGSAEFFADIALCPLEMTKVKMQVSLPGPKGEVTFPRKLMPALARMGELKAETKFPFGSLVPLWGRQIPYTMIKFVGFYLTADFVYDQIEKRTGSKKSDLSDAAQLSVTFASGYWAGIFCAIATQPMDNLVSMKGNPANKDKSFGQMAKDMGTKNLFTKGLGTRVLMIGTLTGLQVTTHTRAWAYLVGTRSGLTKGVFFLYSGGSMVRSRTPWALAPSKHCTLAPLHTQKCMVANSCPRVCLSYFYYEKTRETKKRRPQ